MKNIDWDDIDYEDENENENNDSDLSLMSIKETNLEVGKLLFVDFNYTEPELNEDNNWRTISPEVSTNDFELTDEYSNDREIRESFIDEANRLSDINRENAIINDGINFDFEYNEELDEQQNNRNFISKILMSSNYIAGKGRIGPANNIIISEENYNKYGEYLKTHDNIKKHFEDIDDILVYRNNAIDQPGTICLLDRYKNKYSIESIGFYPEKQFMKIKIK